IIGYQAGKGTALHNKYGNVFLGYMAGYSEHGSNKLYIENSNSSTPLIYGEFDNDILAVNGSLGIGTDSPGEKLDVSGNIKASGTIQSGSSIVIDGTGTTQGTITESHGKISFDDETLVTTGNVGIGTTNPATALDVNGQIRMSTGAADGYIPVSDANGVMTWSSPGTITADTMNLIADADSDTKILVEESPDEDYIRFKVQNVELMKMGPKTGTLEIAASSSAYNTASPGWQSFTAPGNGAILSFEIKYNTSGGSPTKSFKIYEGEGTGGAELSSLGPYTLSNGWNTIPLSTPVSMTSGQKYTIRFTTYAGIGISSSNPYPYGRSSHYAHEDFSVRVNWISNARAVYINTALEVNNTVAATAFVGDGSGLTGITGDNLGDHTATQALNLNTNNITNGGTVTATAFVGDGSGLTGISGDNLGNHTATQAF
ncbi:MAG: hypothetical protein GY746_12420, partial [Gammaproteobacteria bacterium]|nr:hypothetical protein [Gammaproteobacteria bacterium]